MTDYVVAPDRPWLQAATIEWLERTIKPTWTVLETGCGGSTVFFAERCAKLISYENDKRWHQRVAVELVRRQPLHAEVDLRYKYSYPGTGLEFHGLALPALDLALIDGRGRVVSVLDAMPAIRPGGWLVLDDSQRERYKSAIDELDKWNAERLVWVSGPDQTTAWRKP